MKGYLLDTDIVVFILRNHFKAVNRLKELSPSEIYISEVTVAELEYGNHCSGRYDENKPHMLTLFYMQRGMIESNLYIDFNSFFNLLITIFSLFDK